MLYNIIVVVIAIICMLLTLVVLLQNGQGEGLSGMGGGALGGSAGLGARRTADLLSKATSILGGSFLVLCILANFAIDDRTNTRSVLKEGALAPIEDINAPSQTQSAIPVPATNDANPAESDNN